MIIPKTSPCSRLQLLPPNVERDAPFAHAWFMRSEGRATLLSMGNAESEIEESTLTRQKEIIQEFINLEASNRQITRMMVIDEKTIGVVWVELFENHGVKSPSLHIMIGDPNYRGRGIGHAVMEAALDYAKNSLRAPVIYSRHLANNLPIAKLNKTLGFEKDGATYKDKNGLEWQNIKRAN